MRHPTKAWVVLGDDQGPITGFEFPNLIRCDGIIRREPIFFDIATSLQMPEPMEFDLHLFNEGPFTRYTPRVDDQESWTPADRFAITPPLAAIKAPRKRRA